METPPPRVPKSSVLSPRKILLGSNIYLNKVQSKRDDRWDSKITLYIIFSEFNMFFMTF